MKYYNSVYLLQPTTTYSFALKITRNTAEKVKENVKENKQSEQFHLKTSRIVTKPQLAWEQPSGFEWHLLKQSGTSTSVQRGMNGLKCLSTDDKRKYRVGEVVPSKETNEIRARHWC